MATASEYVEFWPHVDAVLGGFAGSPSPHAYRPNKNYRYFDGPSHPQFPVVWGINFPKQGMRVEANLGMGKPQPTAVAEIWLADQIGELGAQYDGPEEVVAEAMDTAHGGRVCRIAVYRSGSVGSGEPPSEQARWFIDRLMRLQSAFATVVSGDDWSDVTVSPVLAAAAHNKLAAHAYRLPYEPAPDRAERLAAAIAAAEFAVSQKKMHHKMRHRILREATWETTEVDGKLTPRFRSPAAMAYIGPKPASMLRHDHVFTRAELIKRMLEPGADVAAVMSLAVGCLVTKDEHTRLTTFDKTHHGWRRFLAAKVDVLDAATGGYVIRDGEYVEGAEDLLS